MQQVALLSDSIIFIQYKYADITIKNEWNEIKGVPVQVLMGEVKPSAEIVQHVILQPFQLLIRPCVGR